MGLEMLRVKIKKTNLDETEETLLWNILKK